MSQPLRVREILLRELDDNGILRLTLDDAMRRNWLFADTPRGARASATCYSLIETAKANGMEPYDYLHHVLKHIAEAMRATSIRTAVSPGTMRSIPLAPCELLLNS